MPSAAPDKGQWVSESRCQLKWPPSQIQFNIVSFEILTAVIIKIVVLGYDAVQFRGRMSTLQREHVALSSGLKTVM
jgi:hypothetical protein